MTLSSRAAFGIAAAAGAAGWLAITAASGRREAWDSEYYFGLFLPALAVVVAWLGFLSPRGAWRWAVVPFAAQAVLALTQNPRAGLVPGGLIVFAVLALVCLVPALVGAVLRRWHDRQSSRA